MDHDVSRSSARRPFLTAAWHDLVIATWPIDGALLRSYLAPGTELDPWHGDALASIVAVDVRDARFLGARIPFHVSFPEVSFGFYVRRKAADGSWQRGMTFIQTMVPRAAIAYVARTRYGAPCTARPMRRAAVPAAQLRDVAADATRSLVYEWRRDGEWERILALTNAPPRPMRAGSVEEFITEHHWGYTRRPGMPALEYQVEHPRWNISLAADCLIEADIETLYGKGFVETLTAAPISTFVAEGSPVAVYPGTPIRA